MSRQIVIHSSPDSNNRRQPLIPANRSPARDKKPYVVECAGSTAAECAAICCCCPFVLVEFLVLAVYKLPTGICRRIWRKRLLRKKLKKARLMKHHAGRDSGRRSTIHCFEDELLEAGPKDFENVKISGNGSAEAVDLDNEMWERFHNTGFGRSLSQRHVW